MYALKTKTMLLLVSIFVALTLSKTTTTTKTNLHELEDVVVLGVESGGEARAKAARRSCNGIYCWVRYLRYWIL